MDDRRKDEGLTWAQLAGELHCTPSQLTGIRTAKFGLNMVVAMAMTQWLRRPATDFVDVAHW